VFAEPSTITGSIGVFGILPTFEATLAKYGVTADGIKTTPLSGQPDLFAGTNATADAFLQAGVEDIYARFLRLVSTSRKLPLDKVGEIAQGRVWDGGTARQLGLVDAFGSLDEAVAEAARMAKISPDSVSRVYLKPEKSFLASLFEMISKQAVRPCRHLHPNGRRRQALAPADFPTRGDARQACHSGPLS
jgi:protease-4